MSRLLLGCLLLASCLALGCTALVSGALPARDGGGAPGDLGTTLDQGTFDTGPISTPDLGPGCSGPEDCQNETVCDGIEQCTNGRCVPGTALSCADTTPTMNAQGTWDPRCTVDSCDPAMGCVNTLRDSDMDGFPPASDSVIQGCTGSVMTDCNDLNAAVFVGAAEACDLLDNNCNGQTDEIAPTWYADCDGDGYAPITALTSPTPVMGCMEPAGMLTGCSNAATRKWVTRRPVVGDRATFDCNDANAVVKPGQTMFFSTTVPAGQPGAGGYDYDCNGQTQQEFPATPPCANPPCLFLPCFFTRGVCSGGSNGWMNNTPPACGASGTYGSCMSTGTNMCGNVNMSRTQRCR